MLKRPLTITIALLVAVVGVALYIAYRVPPGVVPKGSASETLAWVALATAVVSMVTALVGLVHKGLELLHKVLELRGRQRGG
jgi:hypothetical protein